MSAPGSVDCLAPFGALDLLDSLFIGQDSEIPGAAKAGQKVDLVGK